MSPSIVRRFAALWIPLVVASCADERSPDQDREPRASSHSIELRDAVGTTVRLERPARRVVSLAPSLTETLFAVGAGDAVVGRTAYCNYPAAATSVPIVSDMSTPAYETMLRLKPDLVLLTFAGNSSTAYERIAALGMTPFTVAAETIPGTLAAIDTIGALVGRRDQARALVASIERELDSIRALVAARKPVSAFIVLDRAPLMTVSGGFINEAIERAGGINVAAGDPAPYPRYSREEVLRRDPDVIIVPGDTAVDAASLVASFPEWAGLRAVRTGRVRSIPPDILFRPGPRLGQSVVALYAALHGTGTTVSSSVVEPAPLRVDESAARGDSHSASRR